MMFQRIWLVLGLLIIAPAWAEEGSAVGWTGRTDLGYFQQSGSDGSRKNLTFKSELNRTWDQFSWENRAEAISAENGSTNRNTARYLLASKQRLALSRSDYLFVQEQFEKDSTSAFRYQANLTTGYGRQFINNDVKSLEAEVGAGARHSKPKIGASETNPIVTAAMRYQHRLNESARFQQRLSVESGEDNTILRSLTELRFQLATQLSLGVGYDIRREFSDQNARLTIATVSLGYSY